FGQPRSYRPGDMLARVGEAGPGLMVILSGEVEVTQTNGGDKKHIVTHERGNFMGELAQLSGRPYLVDERALTDVEAVAIPPDRLRSEERRVGTERQSRAPPRRSEKQVQTTVYLVSIRATTSSLALLH